MCCTRDIFEKMNKLKNVCVNPGPCELITTLKKLLLNNHVIDLKKQISSSYQYVSVMVFWTKWWDF